jgi:hypothetical protein
VLGREERVGRELMERLGLDIRLGMELLRGALRPMDGREGAERDAEGLLILLGVDGRLLD